MKRSAPASGTVRVDFAKGWSHRLFRDPRPVCRFRDGWWDWWCGGARAGGARRHRFADLRVTVCGTLLDLVWVSPFAFSGF